MNIFGKYSNYYTHTRIHRQMIVLENIQNIYPNKNTLQYMYYIQTHTHTHILEYIYSLIQLHVSRYSS